jgi:hypothetical protein
MKKSLIGLLAVPLLCGAALAEPKASPGNMQNYNTYRSTDLAVTTGADIIRTSVLHKVIVSSASPVQYSSNAVVAIYNSYGGASNIVASVQVSTDHVTNTKEWTFDVPMSSGIYVTMTGTGDTGEGKAQLIYSPIRSGSPDGVRLWQSSYSVVDTAVHVITTKPCLVHKISVLKKGTGTAVLTVYDQRATTAMTSRRVAAIDLTDTAREYNYDMYLSSGLTIKSSGATSSPEIMVFYKENPSQDYEIWRATCTSGTMTAQYISYSTDVAKSGSYLLGGVVNGDSVSGSSLKLYDSVGASSGLIASIDGGSSFDKRMYDVNLSSGLTISSVGDGLYTILYKKR